jgi:hypothetical protein
MFPQWHLPWISIHSASRERIERSRLQCELAAVYPPSPTTKPEPRRAGSWE